MSRDGSIEDRTVPEKGEDAAEGHLARRVGFNEHQHPGQQQAPHALNNLPQQLYRRNNRNRTHTEGMMSRRSKSHVTSANIRYGKGHSAQKESSEDPNGSIIIPPYLPRSSSGPEKRHPTRNRSERSLGPFFDVPFSRFSDGTGESNRMASKQRTANGRGGALTFISPSDSTVKSAWRTLYARYHEASN